MEENKNEEQVIVIKKIRKRMSKKKKYLTIFYIFLLTVLLIVTTYAWFSTALNVQIRDFNVVAAKNSGLSISFDAINYDTFLEISRENIIEDLGARYPTHTNHWSDNGLVPVSTNGIGSIPDKFDFYFTDGIYYLNNDKEQPFLRTLKSKEDDPNPYSYFTSFDIFLKNETGSPVPDNLYLTNETKAIFNGEYSEEMDSLLNTMRFGFVKIGSVDHDTPATTVQNMTCIGTCEDVIYEPYHTTHTDLSIERAKKYGINLRDGSAFPTFGMIKAGGPIMMKNAVSGSTSLEPEYFRLQETFNSQELSQSLFEVPDGVTKVRVYAWLEAQDIDSLETNSTGAELTLSIDFEKDTAGWEAFNY